jgi:hypothetical protein
MVSILKALIVLGALVAFTYAAALALQGNLEMEIIMRDFNHVKAGFQDYLRSF